MGRSSEAEGGGKVVALIPVTDEDVVRLTAIQIDQDAEDALAYVRDRILPEIRSQQGSRLKGPLDGGRGSLR
jgi:hypothetical protein